MKIQEIKCKTVLGKCGFPGGGLSLNPYVGCSHNCQYCYARFMKRFTGHKEAWGSFVDARINAPEILEKQLKIPRFKSESIYIGTVTDPYQPVEKQYKLTRKILEVLSKSTNSISILTKSNLVTRDIDLLKKNKNVEVNFTINSLYENWARLVEPGSSSVKERIFAAKELSDNGIKVFAMMGPFWPHFTDPEKLFLAFKKIGISHVFSESFNTTGSNWYGVEKILKRYFPKLLPEFKQILFNKERFEEFHIKAKQEIKKYAKQYNLSTTIYFAKGHASKFKK